MSATTLANALHRATIGIPPALTSLTRATNCKRPAASDGWHWRSLCRPVSGRRQVFHLRTHQVAPHRACYSIQDFWSNIGTKTRGTFTDSLRWQGRTQRRGSREAEVAYMADRGLRATPLRLSKTDLRVWKTEIRDMPSQPSRIRFFQKV